MKVIANYLPQFHCIPENDEWWGKGFTDWVTVKNAKPLYDGHIQPNEPLDRKYYDLSNVDDIRWQVKLAKNSGIYGFGIYHYWFNDEMKLLEKPAEIIRDHEDIDIHYMFIWDNISWARTWSNVKFASSWVDQKKADVANSEKTILAELVYGNEKNWEVHFSYLLSFFIDKRYVKIDNKPVFAIFNQNNQPEILKRMIQYWDELARKNGFSGIYVLGKKNYQGVNVTDHLLNYEPAQSALQPDNLLLKVFYKIREKNNRGKKPNFYNYDWIWKRIINNAEKSAGIDELYSAFVNFDDSPRRGINGRIVCGCSVEKFKLYFKKLLEISKSQGKEYVFLTAWNEWGEGAYLEPDEINGYAFLDAVKECVDCVNT